MGPNVDLDGSYGFGGRFGYDWGKAKAYGLVGWRHANLSWAATGAGPGDFAGFPSSLNGIDIGAGMAIPLAQGLELGIEGVWTKFDARIRPSPDWAQSSLTRTSSAE